MTRVLQVVSSLDRGGIEIWLLQVLRSLRPDRYDVDFVVTEDRHGALEDEFRALGSRVFRCTRHRRPWQFERQFSAVLRHAGPYDVVHSHIHHYSGMIVRLAARHQVPVRIVHSHNDTRGIEAQSRWPRRLYLGLMRRWIRSYATRRLAVSAESAEDLFGASWRTDSACAVLHCGLDFSPFGEDADRTTIREAVGLPPDALVIGHIGRFFARKNHHFLLEVAAEVFAREPAARLLCVGDGPLMTEIDDRARALGIAERLVIAGVRSDVPRLLCGAMDVFVLPSHHEGLSLALLEAQAAGLPCVIADGLTREGDVVPSRIHRLPLAAGARAWAEAVLRAADQGRDERAWQELARSDFGLDRSVSGLLRIYDAAPGGWAQPALSRELQLPHDAAGAG